MVTSRTQEYYFNALSALYLMLVLADGEEDERELRMCAKMLNFEGIARDRFEQLRKSIEGVEESDLYDICLRTLRNCPRDLQVRCLAWMAIIANADGFMAPEEWKLIYKIYHGELQLDLKAIMAEQKQLIAAVGRY
jgi:uncharacterized tellurite resistance protein B-like protein